MSTENSIAALRMLLKPVARFCLRRSMQLKELNESAKLALLDVAQEELHSKTGRISMSRLSAATGVHRKDISRIVQRDEVKTSTGGLLSRVIGQWRNDPDFTTKAGKPRVLSYGDDDSEFNELVAKVTTDIHAGAVRRELERSKAIEFTPRGMKLVASSYSSSHDETEGLMMLSEDGQDLFNAILQNLDTPNSPPNFHAKLFFDKIDEEQLEKVRSIINEEGSKFLERLSKKLSRFDLDFQPEENDEDLPTKEISVGLFSKTR